MKLKAIFCMLIVFAVMGFSLDTSSVYAYGWGFKKSTENSPPDVGEYDNLLENQEAIYKEDTDEKNIYLTFDNGYEQGFTADMLDVLKKHNVPAAFFVTGHYVKSEPDLIKRMAEEGHIIGNHSYGHPDFTKMSKKEVHKELKKLKEAVQAITDQETMNYVRPPRGTFNEKTLDWTEEFGYTQVFWSLAFKDWETNQQKGWKHAYEQVMDQVHPGAIVLLHTVSEDNAEALDKIIKRLKKDGYQFKSLDDLMIKQYLPDDFYQLMSS